MAIGISIGYKIDENGKLHLFAEEGSIGSERPEKGRSLIAFPEDYVIIDIETTGLSTNFDKIIELSAVKYSDNEKIAEYSTLVNPEREIDEYITELTGITNEMLAEAPVVKECISDFMDFVGDSIVVGYNVNFDINFIYDNMTECLDKPFKNDFVDVMRIARKTLPELKHHRQKDITKYYNLKVDEEHRALADCLTCQECYESLKKQIVSNGISLEEFTKLYKKDANKVHARDINASSDIFDEDNPLFGKICVFTGTLEKMERAKAMQLVADLGGIPADGITKKTNYLILGNNDYCKTIKDGKSSKQKKAEALILAGADLQIIPEQVFYDMLTE